VSKGFAKAFKRDIAREAEVASEKWEGSRDTSTLMNTTRQDLFVYLSRHPCSNLTCMARAVKLSVPTVKWHVERMNRSGFVRSFRFGNKFVFAPEWMVADEDIIALGLLNTPKARRIFIEVQESPGSSQKDISETLSVSHQTVISFTGRLIDEGLLRSVVDGRFIRYFPTDALEKSRSRYFTRMKGFREELIRALKKDGIRPKVLRSTDRYIVMEVAQGRDRGSIRVHTDPFFTSLSED